MEFLTMKNLTDEQIYDIIKQYVEIKVDRMDTQELVEHVTENLKDWYSDFSLEELEVTIDDNDEGLFDELVDNVTSHIDPRLASLKTDNLPDISDNEAEGITDDGIFIDINNTGGKY